MKEYYYEITTVSSAPIIHESPRASPPFRHGAPITDYNKWPKELPNRSIFLYLCHEDLGLGYPEFRDFVREWYKCSCAIMYGTGDDALIIGTGCLCDSNVVVTARHIFENLPEGQIFVRFFSYDIRLINPRVLYVHEDYIDVPLGSKIEFSRLGLDIAYLIPIEVDKGIFQRYMKGLPLSREYYGASIPDGSYAMFHFAYGNHQVSIGNVVSYTLHGMSLHDDIAIQAGNGASGAALIRRSLQSVEGYGISVYRKVAHGWVDREIIAFSESRQRQYMEGSIVKPFFRDMFPYVEEAFGKSSYEFTSWGVAKYCSIKIIHDKFYHHVDLAEKPPSHDEYNHEVSLSNHHIIPKGSLLYLYDYLHDIDASKKCELKQEPEAIQAETLRQYRRFHELLDILCLPFETKGKSEKEKRHWFAWSWWNLFQGWHSNYRNDDPKRTSSYDYEEKHKPDRFPADIWIAVKQLNIIIETLKKERARTSRVENLEGALYKVLCELSSFWLRVKNKHIYPFHQEEWRQVQGRSTRAPYGKHELTTASAEQIAVPLVMVDASASPPQIVGSFGHTIAEVKKQPRYMRQFDVKDQAFAVDKEKRGVGCRQQSFAPAAAPMSSTYYQAHRDRCPIFFAAKRDKQRKAIADAEQHNQERHNGTDAAKACRFSS